jgi:hypothetical protein
MTIRKYDPLDEARRFLYVREVAGNHGQRINGLQAWCGGEDGDSYCAEGATFVLDICYQGHSPVPRLRAVQDIYDLCERNGWLTTMPVPGDLYLRLGDHHHVGFVTRFAFGQGEFGGISFNTSPPTIPGVPESSDGDGCYEHDHIMQTADISFAHIPENGT